MTRKTKCHSESLTGVIPSHSLVSFPVTRWCHSESIVGVIPSHSLVFFTHHLRGSRCADTPSPLPLPSFSNPLPPPPSPLPSLVARSYLSPPLPQPLLLRIINPQPDPDHAYGERDGEWDGKRDGKRDGPRPAAQPSAAASAASGFRRPVYPEFLYDGQIEKRSRSRPIMRLPRAN